MILNVIDQRKLQYRWRLVNAVAEPTWHDNKCPDSDQADPNPNESDYQERANISVSDALEWAHLLPFPVTLYLNDSG